MQAHYKLGRYSCSPPLMAWVTIWTLTPPPPMNDSTLDSGMGSGQLMMSGSSSGSSSASGFGSGSGAMNFEGFDDANDTNDTIVMDRFAPYFSFSMSPNHPIVTVQLGFIDLNQIKRFADLATLPDNTFLSLGTGAFADMNRNPLNEVPVTNATQIGVKRRHYITRISNIQSKLDL